MSASDVRGPPCWRCGLVESSRATKPHRCNPTDIQAMLIGDTAVCAIGVAIRDAFEALRR